MLKTKLKVNLPFEIPKSLASYVEQYEKKPDKTIKRFKKQLQRRGPDAVGYFVLGWFYFRQKEKEKAVECAVKAKTLAPGSPFFSKLHYFFSHPLLFEAWYNPATIEAAAYKGGGRISSRSDLNALIEKLSKVDSKRIKIDSERMANEQVSIEAYDDKEVDGIVSETLASVHEQQGNYSAAICIYEKLKKIRETRTDFYNERIAKLGKLKEGER